jgi:uncharacterized membrane protein
MPEVTLQALLVGIVLLIIIDIPWLLINQSWAGGMIKSIQGSAMSIRLGPALLVYLFMSYLLLIPESYGEAFIMGACIYGVYDATNYATLKAYSAAFAIADTTWGGVLMSTAWWIRKNYL